MRRVKTVEEWGERLREWELVVHGGDEMEGQQC